MWDEEEKKKEEEREREYVSRWGKCSESMNERKAASLHRTGSGCCSVCFVGFGRHTLRLIAR